VQTEAPKPFATEGATLAVRKQNSFFQSVEKSWKEEIFLCSTTGVCMTYSRTAYRLVSRAWRVLCRRRKNEIEYSKAGGCVTPLNHHPGCLMAICDYMASAMSEEPAPAEEWTIQGTFRIHQSHASLGLLETENKSAREVSSTGTLL